MQFTTSILAVLAALPLMASASEQPNLSTTTMTSYATLTKTVTLTRPEISTVVSISGNSTVVFTTTNTHFSQPTLSPIIAITTGADAPTVTESAAPTESTNAAVGGMGGLSHAAVAMVAGAVAAVML
ncbi:hypothetical protein SMACR_09104 [Sordaria macrospora]|uniref:WGS project CABT00000000 data, contig 2.72 n=2 Tax=Sordaria macrospora TaxID=5147 RepID=F7WB97_SORMK|nr:uncharacterized protein SMAC_09104 [Sordaria macrospora k-hell]KAA8628882.1 hypothetical protein SMACR_09104 [Sordaria macrospora]KAH7628871.1 hypothetical protein B0T09DRAFT_168821 [Sordaria sp. MPI-SDFR-AT-0083]WPJ57233.1 hypothetical protein SMAC4_09104 [Sordaria macrospora]CCC14375.1 unnamed protein product [Sordaria macrospora k-hell]